MHGIESYTKIDSEKERSTSNYKNIKYKLFKTNAAIWYKKTCRKHGQLTPKRDI